MSEKVVNNQATCANLKRLLEENGYTPMDVKAELNLASVQTVYKWYACARGKGSSVPSIDNMMMLSAVLHVPLDAIYVTYEITG